MLHKLPHEIIASILAATTAFIGGTALHLPPWAIFIAWAGTYLAGGPKIDVMKRLWCAMPAGSTFALIIILIENQFGSHFSGNWWASTGFQAVVIFVVNSVLMYTGRTKIFALIPGMFFGFASMFATFYGGFGWDPGNPWAAWVSVIAMNFLGPIYAWLAEWLATPRGQRAETHTA